MLKWNFSLTKYSDIVHRLKLKRVILRCIIPVVCIQTNGEVNISHENTTMVVWIYGGV
jgi:hypothetical protein